MIEIDGSQGEGGGQVLRSSLTLALLTGKPVRIVGIRAKRKNPGLQPQHLTAVRSAALIGQATVVGDRPGSSELLFEPGQVEPGRYRFPIGTAGATSLVLHTLFLPLARCPEPSRLTITGGTHVLASPCSHFLRVTWRTHMEQLGYRVRVLVERFGFYPRGGGLIHALIHPVTTFHRFRAVTRPELDAVTITSLVSDLPESIAERQLKRATNRLGRLPVRPETTVETVHHGPGSYLGIELVHGPYRTLFFALGERGKRAEEVADEAVQQVNDFLATDACIDEHSADQLLLPLVYADGESDFTVSRISGHLTTNAAVIGRFLSRSIIIAGKEGQPGRVRIAGP